MPEEQELKLTVTLDDKASAQLGQLLQTMQSLGGTSGSGTSGMNQFANSLRGAHGHAQQLHGGLMGMAAKGGFIAGFFLEIGKGVSEMAKELANAVFNVREYADAMVSLEQSANRAATTAAQFQRNIAMMRESGISAEAAKQNIQGFTDALGDLQKEQSNLRQNLLGGLYGVYREDMQSLIQRTMSAGSKQQAFNEVAKFAREIREFHTRQGNAELGAVAEKEFLARWGIPDADKMRAALEDVSPELEAMYKKRMDNAERFQTAVAKTADSTERGVRSVQASALYMLPLTEAMEGFAAIVGGITKMLQLWETLINGEGYWEAKPGEGQSPEEEKKGNFNERFGPVQRPGSPTTRLPVPGGPGGIRPAETWDKWDPFDLRNWNTKEREDALRDILREKLEREGQRRQQGGAQQLLGDGGDEDRRASIVTNTDQVKSVTEELKRLNDYFEIQGFKGGKVGLLSMPGAGRAGVPGGVAPGTTSGPTRSTPGGTDPDTGTTNPPAPAAPAIPGPYGQPMPPWGTTETGPEAYGGGTGGGVAGNVPGLPGGPSGRALTKEERAAQGQPGGPNGPGGDAGGGGTGGGGAAYLVQQRARVAEELKNDPALRERLINIASYEEPGRDGARRVIEAAVNRAVVTGKPLKSILAGGPNSFYGPLRPKGGAPAEKGPKRGENTKVIDQAVDDVLIRGSNTIDLRTDQGSPGENKYRPGNRTFGTTEEYGYQNETQQKRAEAMQEEYRRRNASNPPGNPPVKTASADPNAPVGPNAPGRTVNVDGKQIPAAVEAGARQAALTGGSSGLREYYRRNGVRLDDQWCGNHAAAIVRSRGLTPPQNPQLASNWNRVTEQGWSEVTTPQAGDIAVAKPGWSRRGSGRTGEVGSHVTTVEEGVDPKTGRFKSFGGNQGDPFRRFNASQFRFYRPPPRAGQNPPPAAPTANQQPPPSTPQSLVPSFMRGRDAAREARVGGEGTTAEATGPSPPRHPDNPYAAGTTQAIIYDKTMAAYKNTPDISSIDRSATKKVAVSGKGKVDVSVKTEPKGAASKKELVKPTPIPRKSQMTPAPTAASHDASLDS